MDKRQGNSKSSLLQRPSGLKHRYRSGPATDDAWASGAGPGPNAVRPYKVRPLWTRSNWLLRVLICFAGANLLHGAAQVIVKSLTRGGMGAQTVHFAQSTFLRVSAAHVAMRFVIRRDLLLERGARCSRCGQCGSSGGLALRLGSALRFTLRTQGQVPYARGY